MAKLYFRHGAMGSSKTLNLLAVAHNYRQQGKEVLLLKPELDIRFGKDRIRSRAGLEVAADILINQDSNLMALDYVGIYCLLVDEAQFLPVHIVDQLREITAVKDIPVICYGLRTDFRAVLFEGSKRLMELADSIEEVKSTCHFCNRKSVFNIKHVDGMAVVDGPAIELGAEEKYFPACYHCYSKQIAEAAQMRS